VNTHEQESARIDTNKLGRREVALAGCFIDATNSDPRPWRAFLGLARRLPQLCPHKYVPNFVH
jgi:hypothetical protein